MLKSLRRGLIVVLAVLIFSVTAHAFSFVAQKKWHSRLEKGEYIAVDEEPESTQPNIYVVVSDPVQIPVNIDGPVTDTDEEPIDDEIDKIVGE